MQTFNEIDETRINAEEFYANFDKIIWDLNIDSHVAYEILIGRRVGDLWLNKEFLLSRILGHLDWYSIIKIIPINELAALITPNVLDRLRPPVKEKYARLQKVLRGEAVSPSGWDPEYRKRARQSILSHRRHCS